MNNKITAIYCRTANPSAPDGFAALVQRETLVCYAKENGHINIACYEDIGFNGLSLTDRPSFQKMQEDINAGKVQTVIARSESRIGRNAAEVTGWIASIRVKGVGFIAADHHALHIDSI